MLHEHYPALAMTPDLDESHASSVSFSVSREALQRPHLLPRHYVVALRADEPSAKQEEN